MVSALLWEQHALSTCCLVMIGGGVAQGKALGKHRGDPSGSLGSASELLGSQTSHLTSLILRI